MPIALLAVAALPLLVKPPPAVLEQYVQWYQHLVGPVSRSPPSLPRCLDDLGTDFRRRSIRRIYTLLQLGGAAVTFGLCLWQRLPIAARSGWSCSSWLLDHLATYFGPGTERNTFSLIAPLTGWAVVVAIRERRAAWLMVSGYCLTVLAAIGGIEDLHPWLQMLHPLGILLFFAWFLRWNALEKANRRFPRRIAGRVMPRPPLGIRRTALLVLQQKTC